MVPFDKVLNLSVQAKEVLLDFQQNQVLVGGVLA
jgi:hypothetical protein